MPASIPHIMDNIINGKNSNISYGNGSNEVVNNDTELSRP